MPAQEGLWLHDEQCPFPGAQLAGQENEQCAVAPGQGRSFDLAADHDQLLTQQSVLEHQLRSAACQVDGSVRDKSCATGPGQAAEKLLDSLEKNTYTLLKEVQSLPFWLWFGGYASAME